MAFEPQFEDGRHLFTPHEASDVISRFYFHGIRSRVLAVRELRQQPRPEEGQSTAHVELDTAGHPELSAYCAAGTLEMLPENAHEEVAKLLPLFGLTEAHLDSQLGFRQRAPQVAGGRNRGERAGRACGAQGNSHPRT